MKKFLIKEVKTYRVDSEIDAKELIDDFSNKQFNNGYKFVKGTYEYKNKKTKGEIIDEWYIVTVSLSYEVE